MASNRKQKRAFPQTEAMNTEAASRVNAFLEEPIPDFIRDVVVDAIAEASRRKGVADPDVHPKQGYDLQALARLFDATRTLSLRAPGLTVVPHQNATRALYDGIARAMLTLIGAEIYPVPPSLDIKSEREEGQDHVLINAIEKHLYMVYESIDFYSSEGMEMYVEMRLLADRQRATRERECKEMQSGEEAANV